MNTRFNDARLAVEKAREALRNGNRTEARAMGGTCRVACASNGGSVADPRGSRQSARQRRIHSDGAKDQSKQSARPQGDGMGHAKTADIIAAGRKPTARINCRYKPRPLKVRRDAKANPQQNVIC